MESSFKLQLSILTFQAVPTGEDALWPMKARKVAAKEDIIEAVTSWECYSETCPDFILVNNDDLTVRIDGSKTFSKEAAGLYVLNILT